MLYIQWLDMESLTGAGAGRAGRVSLLLMTTWASK